ncbi:MAG: flagellin [bacterium]|nr:flagellin [bacterium]
MKILENPTADFAARLLMNASERIGKNLERLSSGKRINRASDDAAGLEISKRMEARIEGMQMAGQNIQNAISLIQTAEAGLNEIHSMLKRIRELLVQGATDTVSGSDRKNIQQEVDELVKEINRSASSVQYNNMNLLNSGAGTDGEAVAISVRDVVTADAGNPTNRGDLPGRGVTRIDVTKKIDEAGFEGSVTGSVTIYRAGVGSSHTVSLKSGTEFKTVQQVMDEISDIPGIKLTYDEEKDIFTLEYEGDITLTEKPSSSTQVGFFSAMNISAYNETKPTGVTPIGAKVSTTPRLSGFYASAGKGVTGRIESNAEIVSDRLKYIDLTTSVAGAGFEVRPTGSIKITTGGREYFMDFDSMDGMVRVQENGKVIAAYSATPNATPRIQDIINWLERPEDYTYYSPGDKATYDRPGPGLKVTYENDMFKIENEEAFELDDLNVTKTHAVGFFTALNIPTTHIDHYKRTATGTMGIIVEGIYGKAGPLRLAFHVGPDKDEVIKVDINEINTKTIGLTEKAGDEARLDVSTREKANEAIELADKAIDFVSKERGRLGAAQNELQHRLNYSGAMEEQETASLSRIRDLDYAREMTKLVKNRILQMAGLGVLAQANVIPSNVLSIL